MSTPVKCRCTVHFCEVLNMLEPEKLIKNRKRRNAKERIRSRVQPRSVLIEIQSTNPSRVDTTLHYFISFHFISFIYFGMTHSP